MEKIKLNFHLKKNDDEKKTVLLRYRFLDLKEKSISISFLKFAEEEWLDKSTCKKFGYLMGKNDMFNRPENKAKFSEEILLLKDIRDEILNYVDNLPNVNSFEHNSIKKIVEKFNPHRKVETEKPKDLFELIKAQIEYHQSIGDLSKGQLKNYNCIHKSLLRFEKSQFYEELNFDVNNFNINIFLNYEDFLIKNKLFNSSIRLYLKNFLSICRKINTRFGLKFDTNYKIKTKNIKEHKEIISEDEVLKIYNYEFEDEKLNYAKKFLLIQFCTGCRFSDLKNLSNMNIVGNKHISYRSVKNHIRGVVLIDDLLEDFLKKNDYNLPTYQHQSTTYNSSLKEMFKIVFPDEKIEYRLQSQIGKGLEKISKRDIYYKYEVIASHMIRRSFATHYLVVKNYPVSVVSQMMAHTSVTTTFGYVNLNYENGLKEQEKYKSRNLGK